MFYFIFVARKKTKKKKRANNESVCNMRYFAGKNAGEKNA